MKTYTKRHESRFNQPKLRSKSLMIVAALAAAFATVQASAQEKYAESKDQGDKAVVQASESVHQQQPTASSGVTEQSIKNQLNDKLAEAGIRQSWDDDKNRFGGVAVFKYKVDPKLDFEDYFMFRQTASLGAMLNAQIDVATWLGAEAGMEVMLSNPGDPFFGEKLNSKAKQEIEERMAKLNAEAAELGGQLKDAQGSAMKGVTTVDRFNAASDALIKAVDKDYDKTKITQEKQAKVEALKADAQAVAGQLKELEKAYDTYKNAYNKTVKSGIEMTYDHVIFGLSAVCWGENLSPDGELTIGLAYVWSPKLAKSVHAALTGEPGLDSDNVKGEESLDSWVRKQDYSTLGAFRYYVDDKGDRWFVGCSAAANSLDRADQLARISAIQNLYMPLYSKLTGRQVVRTETKSGKPGGLPAKVAEDLVEELRSGVKANTRGLNQLVTRDLNWPAKVVGGGTAKSGSVAVSVVALNAKSAAAALKANVQMALAARDVERENNRRRLEQQQLMGMVEQGKKETPPSRVPAMIGQQRPSDAVAAPKAPSADRANPTPREGLTPQPGSRITPGKPKDDF